MTSFAYTRLKHNNFLYSVKINSTQLIKKNIFFFYLKVKKILYFHKFIGTDKNGCTNLLLYYAIYNNNKM